MAALLCAPMTTALTPLARAASPQDQDVPSDAEQALFSKGQSLYNQGRYEQAAAALKDFLKNYPNSIITDLTLLWLGRSYMQLGQIQEAEQVSQRLHAIKDTPFADIYDSELQTARREQATRGTQAVASNPRPSQTSRPPAIKPAMTPTPTPVPIARQTPTPAPTRTPLNINRNPTPTNPNPSATTTTATAKPSPTPRLIDKVQPTETQETAANNRTAQTPRTSASGRNSRRYPPRGQAATQQVTRTATPQPSPTPMRTPTPTQQVAVNRPPRPNPTPTRPVVTPTPNIPSNTAPSANTENYTPVEAPPTGAQGGMRVIVKQVPSLLLSLNRAVEAASPGQAVQLPLTIQNTGNNEDQFRIETDLPAEFQPSFAQNGQDTGLPAYVTPTLARNQTLDVTLNLRVPETATDGQQRRFSVRATSQSDYQVQRLADGTLNVVAAALAASSNTSQTTVMPGETFTQTIVVRNNGSSAARNARADFIFNPNFELVSASPSPIQYDRASRIAIWTLGDLNTHSDKEIKVTLRALPEALAGSNTLGRGAVRTQSLPFGSNFDSPSVAIGKVPRAEITAVSVGLTATPGDTIWMPFVVRNPGNSPDAYELRMTAPGAPSATIYADTNGDGQHQDSEPSIGQTAQIDPQGGQFPLLVRVQIPGNTPDRQQFSYNVVARSLTSNRVAGEANTVLTVATPRVRVRTEGMTGDVRPGDTFFYRLVLVNEGSGLAKNLVVDETLSEALQFMSSDPQLSTQDAGGNAQRFVWRVPELAPGDTAVLRVTVRVRPGITASTVISTQHTLSYQDTNNNGYRGQ